MEFLTDWGVVIALICAAAALVYGVATSRWLLAKSPGNQEMQSISLAVQEGAKAYLTRQYTIIGGVAAVLAKPCDPETLVAAARAVFRSEYSVTGWLTGPEPEEGLGQ